MQPKFNLGDLVVIDPTAGDFVFAAVDVEATFREYRTGGVNERGERVFILHALNPIHGPVLSDRQRIEIKGVAVERRRACGGRG